MGWFLHLPYNMIWWTALVLQISLVNRWTSMPSWCQYTEVLHLIVNLITWCLEQKVVKQGSFTNSEKWTMKLSLWRCKVKDTLHVFWSWCRALKTVGQAPWRLPHHFHSSPPHRTDTAKEKWWQIYIITKAKSSSFIQKDMNINCYSIQCG